MRPYLDPALPLLWRDEAVLQIGLDPAGALAVAEASPDLPAALAGLRGQVPQERVDAALHPLLAALAGRGLVCDGPPAEAWSQSWVHVAGVGPTAATVAARLRAAGIGRCSASPDIDPGSPDLTVVAPQTGRGLALADRLVAAGRAHLWVHVRDGRAVVGPLVEPGRTSCLRCQDLHRTDSDPAWPRLAVAWEQSAGPPPVGLAGRVAGVLAARQALAWVAGREVATRDGTLEEQPDGSFVRGEWPAHPGCGCGWDVD